MAGETRRAALREVPARGMVRHLQAGTSGRNWNRAAHQTCLLDLCVIQCLDSRSASPKLIRIHAAHGAIHPGVAIQAGDIRVAYDGGAARETSTPEACVESTSIPGMKYFKRR